MAETAVSTASSVVVETTLLPFRLGAGIADAVSDDDEDEAVEAEVIASKE